MIMRRSSSALQVTFSQLCHVKTLQSFFCRHILTTGQRKQLLAVYSFYAVFRLWFILLEKESHLSFSPWGFVFPFFPHLSFFIFWFKFCLILSWRVLSTTSLKFAWLHLSSFFVPFVLVLFLYFFFFLASEPRLTSCRGRNRTGLKNKRVWVCVCLRVRLTRSLFSLSESEMLHYTLVNLTAPTLPVRPLTLTISLTCMETNTHMHTQCRNTRQDNVNTFVYLPFSTEKWQLWN